MRSIVAITLLALALICLLAARPAAAQPAATPTPARPAATTATATVTATATLTATATAAPAPQTPTVASTRTISDTLGGVTTTLNALTTPAFALAKLLGAVVAFMLGLLVFWRILGLTLFRPPDLIVDTFINASGDDALDSMLAGFGQRAREQLLAAMDLVNDNVKKHVKLVGPETYHAADKTPLPSGAPDQTAALLVGALKDLAPKELSPIVQLLNIAFPPRGVKVSTTLQRRRDDNDRVGVTFEIADLRGRQEPRLYTIWERQPARAVEPDTPAPPAPPTPPAPRSLLDRLIDGAPQWIRALFAKRAAPPPAPPAEKPEALARYTIGRIYEGGGDLAQARTFYEDALKEDPGYDDAAEALKAALQARREVGDRYMALLWPATLWLALELAKREMLAAEARISLPALLRGEMSPSAAFDALARRFQKSAHLRYHGQVHNFFGALYLAGMSSSPYETLFYQLAVKAFQEAIASYQDWYQPYENLAEAYSLRARKLRGGARNDLLHDAILEYAKANKRVDRIVKPHDRKLVQDRIKIGQAAANLLIGVQPHTEEAIKIVQEVEQSCANLADVSNAQFLYNLASCYALAHSLKLAVNDAWLKARRCLAYCLARDRDYLYGASQDSDLASVRGSGATNSEPESARGDLGLLVYEVERKLDDLPDLAALTGKRFADAIEDVMTRAKWLQKGDATP